MFQIFVNEGKYSLGRKIGFGNNGDIYSGTNVDTKENVAIKLEPARRRSPMLQNEFNIYSILNSKDAIKQTENVPKAYWFGREGDFNVLIMELLGSNLGELKNKCGGKFTLKTVLMIADQVVY